jgi:putative ABC transport system substrate-binding protein
VRGHSAMSAYLLALSTLPPGAPAVLLLTNRFGGAFFCVGQGTLARATMPGYAHNPGVICYPEISLSSGLGGHMRRRDFITILGGAAAWPLVARAQQVGMPVIGFLGTESPGLSADRLHAFLQGLGETGYIDGRDVAIDYRWAEGKTDRLPALAAELVRRRVTAIVTFASTAAAVAAKAATTTIPIIFAIAGDPIAVGLVVSLNRPGGNLTGVTSLNEELYPKRLELLHELVPTATMIALLVNPTNPNAEADTRDAQVAAQTLGVRLHVIRASTEHDLNAAFASLGQLGAGALVISSDSLFNLRSEQLAALTFRYAMPTIFQTRAFASAGGLMSYGVSVADIFHQQGIYTGRILRGEKPADLPVQRATKVELIIDLKTAKVLGITVPLSLLGRADEVIE